jgi:hypothetical protein
MRSTSCALSLDRTSFEEVLGLLLRDAELRGRFQQDRAAVVDAFTMASDDREAALQLEPEDLEFQATILLRKRFQALARLLPETIAALGADAWTSFMSMARNYWPRDAIEDASRFVVWINETRPAAVSLRELVRARFELSARRVMISLVPGKWALQILLRWRGETREWLLRLGPGKG